MTVHSMSSTHMLSVRRIVLVALMLVGGFSFGANHAQAATIETYWAPSYAGCPAGWSYAGIDDDSSYPDHHIGEETMDGGETILCLHVVEDPNIVFTYSWVPYGWGCPAGQLPATVYDDNDYRHNLNEESGGNSVSWCLGASGGGFQSFNLYWNNYYTPNYEDPPCAAGETRLISSRNGKRNINAADHYGSAQQGLCASVTAGSPDLVGYVLDGTGGWGSNPYYATAGQPITLTGITFNHGDATAPGGTFYDLYYIYDANYNYIGYTYSDPVYSGAIDGYNNYAYRYGSYTFGTPGTYHYLLIADYGGAVAESNEGNNYYGAYGTVIVSPPPAANLYSNIGSSMDITAGQTATLTGATYNNGNATAPGGTFYDLFTIYDTAYNYSYANGSTYYTYTDPVYSAAIGSGGGITRYGYYNFPSPGTWYYRLNADWYSPNGAVAESNEGDNSSGFAAVTVHPITPTGLTFTCSANGTYATASWDATPGAAAGYYLRGSLSANQNGYGATSYGVAVTPGTSYDFYVYAENTASNYSLTPASISVNCAGSPELTSVTGGARSAIAGTPIQLTGTTYNNGNAASPGTYDLIRFTDANGNWIYPSNNGVYYLLPDQGYPDSTGIPAGGGSRPRTASFNFTVPGTYYYSLCSDWPNYVGESNEGNNCSALAPITVKPAAPASVTHSCNANGTQATVSWSAVSGASAGYYVRLFDNSLGGYQAITNDYTGGTSITYSIVPGHSYSSWVHAEQTSSNYSDPTYDNSWSCAGQADLTAGIGPAVTIVAGQAYTYTGTTYNTGNATAGAHNDLFIFYNANQSDWNGYTYTARAGALGSGGSDARSAAYTFTSPGTYYYRLCTDWSGEVPEGAQEGNNCSAFQTVTVKPVPPTINPGTSGLGYSCNANGTSVDISWNAVPGANSGYYIRGSVTNYDNYPSTSGTWTVTPGVQNSISIYAENTPANYSDPTSLTFTCNGKPNLTSTNGGARTVIAGTPVTLTGTTYNNGNVTAPAGVFYDLFRFTNAAGDTWTYPNNDGTYYLLANPTYSGAITPGGNLTRSTNSFTFTVPGTYYYSLCSDWGGNVTEISEGDNCSATASITVQPPIPPNPATLTHTCSADGYSVTMNWSAAPGAIDYYVRLYDGISNNPYAGYAGYNDNYAGTSITYPSVPGRGYTSWVHSRNGTGYSNPPIYEPAGGSGTFSCAGYPNLRAGTVSAPASVLPGSSVALSAAVSNVGTGAPGSFPTLFQVQETGALIASAYTSAPATASASYTFPTPGTYHVRACVNNNTSWANIVSESDYSDNCSPTWTTVVAAYTGNLSCTFAPSNPEVGQTVTFNANPSGSATSPYTWTDSLGNSSYPNSSTITKVYGSTGSYGMTVAAAGTISPSYQCRASDGSGPNVQVGCAAPHTATLTASPTRVKAGQTTNLTFSGQGINTSCTITGTNGYMYTATANSCLVTTASVTTTPINTQTTFTISCDGGIATKSVVVNVTPKIIEF